jgi:alanine dehydrogenase
MRVGVPKEIKPGEHRVGLTPTAVREYVTHGHQVLVQSGAGLEAGYDDAAYARAGADLAPDAEAVFQTAELIIKVKEPQKIEWERLRPGQILFTYLHLAPDPAQTEGLLKSGAAAIAYETVTDRQGGLPLLAPMSEVAGRIAVFSAASRVFSMDCCAAADKEPKKPPFLAATFGASASAVVLPQTDSSAAAGAPAAAAAGAAAAVCLSRTSAAACAICWFEGSTSSPASYVANASSYRPRPYSAAPLRE